MLRSSLFWLRATWTLLRQRRRFVPQTARTDCGVACALTVLAMSGRKADPVAAVEFMDADRDGTSLDTLRRFFEEEQGFEATALAVPPTGLRRVRGRVILHMQQQHYVLLLRTGRNGVLVFDPAMGPVFYPAADFAALYSGNLLAVRRKRRATLPARLRAGAGQIVGGAAPGRLDMLALGLMGLAGRLLEGAILLCLVAALFLVLNHASTPSLLGIFGVLIAAGAFLLIARQARYEGEDALARRRQSRIWRGLLRISIRGRDLNGFRGRYERDVSGAIRRGMIISIPQRAQLPGALGAILGMSGLLCVLNPIIAGVHLGLFGLLIVLLQLDDVQVCRRSVREGIGRYTRLGQNRPMLSGATAPDMMGEIARWTVIGFAGFSVLMTDLSPVALMFWILTGMQIVPTDFRRARVLLPTLAQAQPISGLVGVEVPLRRQKVVSEARVKVASADNLLRIDGIAPLTATLGQPDLTVREQRLIMADVVRLAIANMPEDQRPDLGPIRIFGPGQDATQADFEHLMIAQESRPSHGLPAVVNPRQVMDQSAQDPVLRDLHSCAPGDFPVFWDFRNRMAIADIRSRLEQTGLRQAGHMTMKRLTVIRAA